jgi:hypothetical protein
VREERGSRLNQVNRLHDAGSGHAGNAPESKLQGLRDRRGHRPRVGRLAHRGGRRSGRNARSRPSAEGLAPGVEDGARRRSRQLRGGRQGMSKGRLSPRPLPVYRVGERYPNELIEAAVRLALAAFLDWNLRATVACIIAQFAAAPMAPVAQSPAL